MGAICLSLTFFQAIINTEIECYFRLECRGPEVLEFKDEKTQVDFRFDGIFSKFFSFLFQTKLRSESLQNNLKLYA